MFRNPTLSLICFFALCLSACPSQVENRPDQTEQEAGTSAINFGGSSGEDRSGQSTEPIGGFGGDPNQNALGGIGEEDNGGDSTEQSAGVTAGQGGALWNAIAGSEGGEEGTAGREPPAQQNPPLIEPSCDSDEPIEPLREDETCESLGFTELGEVYRWVINDYQILTDQPYPFIDPQTGERNGLDDTNLRATLGRDIDGRGHLDRDVSPFGLDEPTCRSGSPRARTDFYNARLTDNEQAEPTIDNALVHIAKELQQTLFDSIQGGGEPPPGVSPYFSNFISHNANVEGDLYLVLEQTELANEVGEVGCARLKIYLTDASYQPNGQRLETQETNVFESFENPNVPRERIIAGQDITVRDDQVLTGTEIEMRVRSCNDGQLKEASATVSNLPISMTVEGEDDSGSFGFEFSFQQAELSYRYNADSIQFGLISGVLNTHQLLDTFVDLAQGNAFFDNAIEYAAGLLYEYIDINMAGFAGAVGQLKNPGIRVPARRTGVQEYEWLGGDFPELPTGIIEQSILFEPGRGDAPEYAPNCQIQTNGRWFPVELVTSELCEGDQTIIDVALQQWGARDFNPNLGIVKYPGLIREFRTLYGGDFGEVPQYFWDDENLLCEGLSAGIGISSNAAINSINVVND